MVDGHCADSAEQHRAMAENVLLRTCRRRRCVAPRPKGVGTPCPQIPEARRRRGLSRPPGGRLANTCRPRQHQRQGDLTRGLASLEAVSGRQRAVVPEMGACGHRGEDIFGGGPDVGCSGSVRAHWAVGWEPTARDMAVTLCLAFAPCPCPCPCPCP